MPMRDGDEGARPRIDHAHRLRQFPEANKVLVEFLVGRHRRAQFLRSATKRAAARSTSPLAPKIDSADRPRASRSRTRCLAPSMPSWVTKVVLPSAASCAGRLAERRRVALDVEQIVGDLEGFAERAAVIVERLIFLLRGLAEDRAGDAAVAQQRAGLHLLQPRDVDRLAVAEAAFAGEIEHLAADHAADAGGARQRAGQQQAHSRRPCGSRRG